LIRRRNFAAELGLNFLDPGRCRFDFFGHFQCVRIKPFGFNTLLKPLSSLLYHVEVGSGLVTWFV
jgi:hypothetical protein